jgi:putative ATP-dependent endonuclease of OLD family
MHLSELTIENLRTCKRVRIPLRPDLTVLTGCNGTGKSTVLETIRQLTKPVDGSRVSALNETDLTHDSPPGGRIRLHAALAGIEPQQVGTYRDALLPGDDHLNRRASWSMTYTPPRAGRRRGTTTWHVGEGRESTVSPVLRTAVRHMYLPAGRDAFRELSGPAGATRVRVILEALLADSSRIDAFLDRIASSWADVSADPVVQAAGAAFSRPMAAFTYDADEAPVGLFAANGDLRELSRVLRAGSIRPFDRNGSSGLGHAHALYLATVLAELELVKDTDLTVLLIDAPEAHLHPALHPSLIAYLQHLARASRSRTPEDPAEPAGQLQVVVSTHAPGLATASSARDLVVLTRLGPQPTHPVTVAELELADSEIDQLDRYLSVTRSALMQGTSVLLVPTMAEAVLVSAMAASVLPAKAGGDGWVGRDLVRFQTATVVAASDIDCDVILKVLISRTGEPRFRQRIAVLTGTMPEVPRKHIHVAPADDTGLVRWFGLGETIWQALMCSANEPILRAALLKVTDDGERRWQTIAAEDLEQRPQLFQSLFNPGLGGEASVCGIRYANALADLLRDGEPFTVPVPVAAAIRHLAHTEYGGATP